MKERLSKRGLYRRTTRTPETENESLDNLKALADSLSKYIAEAEKVAGAILRHADIDPDTLFDFIGNDDAGAVQYTTIDREELSAEVDQAFEVMLLCHSARNDFQDTATKDGLQRGILLAQAVDNLNANLAWQKHVEDRRRQIKNLRHDEKVSDEEILKAISEHGTQEKAAENLDMSSRQLRRRLKKLK